MSADCVSAPAGVTFILKPFQGPRDRYAYQSWCRLSLSFPCVPGIPGIRVVHAGASSSRGQSTVDVVTRRPEPLLLALSLGAMRGTCVPAGQICLSQAGSQDQLPLLPGPCWRGWRGRVGPPACQEHGRVTQAA